MKKGLWVLTFLGVALAVTHHQLTAQESPPLAVEAADAPAPTVSAPGPIQRDEFGGDAPLDMSESEMRTLLKKQSEEAIDRLDRAELEKQVREFVDATTEKRAMERLDSISRELEGIARRREGSPSGKRAAWGARALATHPDAIPVSSAIPPSGLDPVPNPYEIHQRTGRSGEQMRSEGRDHQRTGRSGEQMRAEGRDHQRPAQKSLFDPIRKNTPDKPAPAPEINKMLD